MSGIFNGNSIYKSGGGGGGGGGYKDGGELVDADLIKVENNSVSSYDNISRDPVNFYFDTEGEILNSVIQFTTQVNSTVNVYVLRNGFYFLLNIIGVNTVNAGDEYTINIIGDSYEIEQTTPQNNDPEYANINGEIVKVLKVNNILWSCSNLGETEFEHVTVDGVCYYENNKDIVVGGWRLPTKNEVIDLNNAFTWQELRSTSGWPSGYNGTNASGFNSYPYGNYTTQVSNKNYSSYIMYAETNKASGAYMYTNNKFVFGGGGKKTVRLVFDL